MSKIGRKAYKRNRHRMSCLKTRHGICLRLANAQYRLRRYQDEIRKSFEEDIRLMCSQCIPPMDPQRVLQLLAFCHWSIADNQEYAKRARRDYQRGRFVCRWNQWRVVHDAIDERINEYTSLYDRILKEPSDNYIGRQASRHMEADGSYLQMLERARRRGVPV